MSEWLVKSEFALRPGWTLGKIHSKIYRHKWTRGVEYALIDGEHWINVEAVERWITQQALEQRETALKSVTNGKVNDTEKYFKRDPIKPTSPILLE